MRLVFLSQGIIEQHRSVRLDIQNKNFVRVQTFVCHFYRRANGLPVSTPYVFRREAYRNDLVTWKEISGVVSWSHWHVVVSLRPYPILWREFLLSTLSLRR